jgi:nitrate/TMAO reductase-like tetraheme cytochrome c subunit
MYLHYLSLNHQKCVKNVIQLYIKNILALLIEKLLNDEIHKAVWDKHPLKQKKMYKCAKCHTPNDRAMIVSLKNGRKAMPKDNKAQQEGISCVSCHNIKSVEKHAKSNKNIITNDKKKLYSARESEKSNKRKSYSIKSS